MGLNLLQLLGGDKSISAGAPVMMENNTYMKHNMLQKTPMFSKKMIQRGLMQGTIIPNALVPAVEQVRFP